jgi:hypothetical protein
MKTKERKKDRQREKQHIFKQNIKINKQNI